MGALADIGSWIAANEQVLSGLAAIIVVAGVLLSPIGVGLKRLGRSRTSPPGVADPGDAHAVPTSTIDPGPGRLRPARRITFQDLTAPGPFEVKFARSDELRIAYAERGNGPPDILLAPGIFSHLHITSNLPATAGTMEGLARFARVVTFDKRGQGLSDPALRAPTLEERTRDIEAVMDAAGLERAVLLGVSEGGPMCLSFAHANPDRVQGLVILGSTATWVQREDFPIGVPRGLLQRMPEAWGTAQLRAVFFPSLSREQIDDDTYRSFERLIGNRTAVRQLVEMMMETDVRPLLPEIHAPTLVVHFTGDLAVPIRMGRCLAEGLPNAEFLEVNAVDHADLSSAPHALERVEAFCRRVTAAA
jgi:pimeloyl-ACP methyl ester carboxylesterase